MNQFKNNVISNQSGIALVAGALIAMVLIVVVTAGIGVYSYQKSNSESNKRQSEDAKEPVGGLIAKTQEQKETVDLPAGEEEKEPADETTNEKTKTTTETKKTEEPKPTVKTFKIANTTSKVDPDSVTLGAYLGTTYSGTCKALVKKSDGGAKYFEQKFSSSSTCMVNIPIGKLSDSSAWKFYMYYYNDGQTIKGSSDVNTLFL
jgi:hypothetical protein